MTTETIARAPVNSPKRRYHGDFAFDNTDLDDPSVRAGVDPHLTKPDPVDPDAPNADENLTQEEITYKKRYGDLRRHQQLKEKELSDRIKELERQTAAAAKKELVLPKTDEEVEEWRKQFPDVFDLIKTISAKEVASDRETVDSRLAEIEEMKRDVKREKAENKIRAKHSNFDDLKNDPEFHDWAKEQPRYIQAALYENDDDADSVIRVIDLYNADNKAKQPVVPPKKNNDARDAAQSVTRQTRTTPATQPDDGKIYESDVKKMTPRQFEKNEAAIEDAMRNGRFVYDVSGGAR